MIKRINLIEKKPFTFTYQRLLQICLCVLLLLAVMVELAVLKSQRLQKKITATQEEITRLELKKEELTKQKPVKKTVSVGAYQELFDLIQSTPHWSKIISEVGEQLPQTVWITQFQSASSLVSVAPAEPSSKDKSSKTPAPQPQPKVAKNTLQLNGVSSDMRAITEFTTKVSRLAYLQNVVLDESVRQGYGFMFKLTGEINAHAR
jgi:Tfp pilus assembly protein PilN